MTADSVVLTVDEAIAAVERCKWIVPDEWDAGEPRADAGREIVHCFRGSIGADWDASAAIELIRRSELCAFAWFLFGGVCLGVKADGNTYWFDGVHPEKAP